MKKAFYWVCLYILPTIFFSGQPSHIGSQNNKSTITQKKSGKEIKKENIQLKQAVDINKDSIQKLVEDIKLKKKEEPRVVYRTRTKSVPVLVHDTIYLSDPVDLNDYIPDTVWMLKTDTVHIIKTQPDKRNLLQRIFNSSPKNKKP